MTDNRWTRPERPALTAGRILLRILRVLLAIPFGLAWLLLILLLPFGRAFVQLPLALATIGGLGVGVYFGLHHAWGDAASAVAAGSIAGLALAGFTAVAESIDPDFSRPTPLPPWWWYF